MLRVLALLSMLVAGSAQAQMWPFPGPGRAASGGGSSYQGPGDVVSGAYAWYSCSRGYNAADTAAACNVCLPSDTTCDDITLSNGFAVLPGSLSTCNITTVICTVKTAYDKTGSGRNATQATESQRPRFRPAMASNGCPTTALPCMLFVAASTQQLIYGSNHTQALPVTVSVVWQRGSSSGDIFFTGGPIIRAGNNDFGMNAGSLVGTTATNGSWHAAQGVFAGGASSAAYVDAGSSTGLSVGSNSVTLNVSIGQAIASANYDGYLAEVGVWPSGFNATQAGDMNTNQHGSNGYNF